MTDKTPQPDTDVNETSRTEKTELTEQREMEKDTAPAGDEE